jgi:UDP:flavonoid glycosyltransferase YjiC (YdhE family)
MNDILSLINNQKTINSKPLIGFFPLSVCIGDTFPLVKIAKEYMKTGGKVIFFSHGGEYEKMINELGCEIIKVEPYYPKETSLFVIVRDLFQGEKLARAVKEEIKVFKETEIRLLITSFNLPSSISARVVKIPLVFLHSGTISPPYFESGYATFPEESEVFFTRMIPDYFKNLFYNWHMLRTKGFVKQLNVVAKSYNIPPFKRYLDIIYGDHYFLCDDLGFLGLNPTPDFSAENFIGPILPDDFPKNNSNGFDKKIINHLRRPGRFILLTMGSSRHWKNIFLKILHCLNQTEYNVIATYTNILRENEIPKLNDNILLSKYIKNISEINKKVDLAIIHGGRGTVYTAAYSGRPTIGFPLHHEQQFYLDNLARHKCSLRLSRKFFKEKDLLDSIEKIFNNYNFYLKNSQLLANKLEKPIGAKKAVKRLIEIYNNTINS